LKGAKNCVDAAKGRIAEIVTNLQNQITLEVEIDQQHHRTIMGARGANLQRICAEHDVQIKIPERQQPGATDNGNGGNNIIRVTGNKDKCEAAAEALRALVPVSIEVS